MYICNYTVASTFLSNGLNSNNKKAVPDVHSLSQKQMSSEKEQLSLLLSSLSGRL